MDGKNVKRTFLDIFFGGACNIQTVPKYVWMWYCHIYIDTVI